MNRKKQLTGVTFLLALSTSILSPSAAFAASEDECAIWLCLPGGFPSGCGAAKSAMKDRLEDFKPPLPNFSSCAVSSPGSSTMSHTYSYAAHVPEREVCEWVPGEFGFGRVKSCKTVPEHYVEGTSCNWADPFSGGGPGSEKNNPPGCTLTYRYIDVFVDGIQAGERYYWHSWR